MMTLMSTAAKSMDSSRNDTEQSLSSLRLALLQPFHINDALVADLLRVAGDDVCAVAVCVDSQRRHGRRFTSNERLIAATSAAFRTLRNNTVNIMYTLNAHTVIASTRSQHDDGHHTEKEETRNDADNYDRHVPSDNSAVTAEQQYTLADAYHLCLTSGAGVDTSHVIHLIEQAVIASGSSSSSSDGVDDTYAAAAGSSLSSSSSSSVLLTRCTSIDELMTLVGRLDCVCSHRLRSEVMPLWTTLCLADHITDAFVPSANANAKRTDAIVSTPPRVAVLSSATVPFYTSILSSSCVGAAEAIWLLGRVAGSLHHRRVWLDGRRTVDASAAADGGSGNANNLTTGDVERKWLQRVPSLPLTASQQQQQQSPRRQGSVSGIGLSRR